MTELRAAVVLVSVGLVSTPAAGDEANARAAAWKRTDLKPVSQPSAVGDRLVLYAAAPPGLRLIAVSGRTGSTLWSVAATPSLNARGEAPTVMTSGGTVIYMRPAVGGVTELVARDVATGRDLWRVPGLFTSWPEACPESPAAVCVTGSLLWQKRQTYLLSLDAGNGETRAIATLGKRSGGRRIAPGLFDPGARSPELLLAAQSSRVTWRQPLGNVFTLQGSSTDWGWNFDRIERHGLFVGSPGWAPRSRTSSRIVVDVSRSITAGFRIRDGAVAWRSRGTTYRCTYLPCPGQEDAGAPSVGVRFRESGTVTATRQRPKPVASRGAKVVVEGFDPHTGRTLWTFDAGREIGLLSRTYEAPQLDATTVVLRDERQRRFAVDLSTGSKRSVPPSTRGWCRESTRYTSRRTGGSPVTWAGRDALFPCTVAGRRSSVGRAPAFVGEIGARVGSLVVWSERSAVVGAPQGG
jgi:outer membrane protein assembly factor BamB